MLNNTQITDVCIKLDIVMEKEGIDKQIRDKVLAHIGDVLDSL